MLSKARLLVSEPREQFDDENLDCASKDDYVRGKLAAHKEPSVPKNSVNQNK